MKEDIAILSSLCSDILSQSGIVKQKPKKREASQSPNRFSQNRFLKTHSQVPESLDFVFRKFSSAAGLVEAV